MLEKIRIVLVNTSHPGNIGSAARAMKNMGLKNLVLVDPYLFPHQKAKEMAASADDILENATVVKTLEEAISEATLVVGTSARSRTIPWPMLTPRELGNKILQEENQQIAVVFGREQSGLTNEELQRCHYHIHIPSNPDYSALNLAAAVQVVAYELRLASLSGSENENKWDFDFATMGEMEGFYEHFEKVLIDIDFLDPNVPRQLMPRIRRLFNRVRPDNMEIRILRGILGAVAKLKG